MSVRHASAQSSRVRGDCMVLLYSRRPSSAHIAFVGGFGLGVAEGQDVGPVKLGLALALARQLADKSVIDLVLVWLIRALA